MKVLSIIISVILFLLSAVCLLLLFVSTKNQWILILLAAVFSAVGVFLIYNRNKIAAKPKPTVHATPAYVSPTYVPQATAPVKQQVPDGEMNYNIMPDFVDYNVLRYEYEDGFLLLDGAAAKLAGNGGKLLSFAPDRENAYDHKAIAIYLLGEKIGYVYKGKIQDMVNDWIVRDEVFVTYLNRFSVADNKATFKIGFYKPLENYESKKFRLVKLNKKDYNDRLREDNISESDVGLPVTFEYEHEAESYFVYDDIHNEIGELPKSADAFIGDEDTDNLDDKINCRFFSKAYVERIRTVVSAVNAKC